MKKEIFEGIKYTIINCLIKEYQNSKDINYRNEVLSVITALNNFLDYNNFENNCEFDDIPTLIGKNTLRIRNIAVSSINNIQIESYEKDKMLVEITKFFCKSMEPKQKEIIIKKRK